MGQKLLRLESDIPSHCTPVPHSISCCHKQNKAGPRIQQIGTEVAVKHKSMIKVGPPDGERGWYLVYNLYYTAIKKILDHDNADMLVLKNLGMWEYGTLRNQN